MLNAILRLRRDNDYNYAKIKDTFVPADGEICLVDTARDGLRAVCGDGITPFGQLEYVGDIIVKGYYDATDDIFYSNIENTKAILGSTIKLYIDIKTSVMYYYDGTSYNAVSNYEIPTASATISGVMRLYDTLGYNTDGTMTQKAITKELEEKFEVTLDTSEEMIIFTT